MCIFNYVQYYQILIFLPTIFRVTAISNTTVKLSFNEEEQLIVQEMNDSDVQEFNLIAQGIART